MDKYPKRRIFINSGNESYQIFSFRQESDGSIYCSSPSFADAKWISFEFDSIGQPVMVATEAIGEGKISVHGSGVAGIRNNTDPHGHKIRIKGSQLLSEDGSMPGARHLFSAYMSRPRYQPPGSPALNRKSDYIINTGEDISPFVLVFFAIPSQARSINFEFSLHETDMEGVPDNFLGMHHFNLKYHDISWFAYKTKHMEKWPINTQFSYHDGYFVPIFIGTGHQEFRLEFRDPEYTLSDEGDLTINCSHNANNSAPL